MKFFCTTVTASHLPYACALAESLRRSGNREPLYVLLVGGARAETTPDPQIVIVELDDLRVTMPPLMRYYYSAFELCNALKPFLVSHLFEQLGASKVIYLDSDLMITDRFERIWNELDSTSLLLTPHHLTPPALTSRHTNEIDIIDLGFLNGGFAAWRAGDPARRMLEWMRERFAVYGFYRHLGMASDQKLLPLLLAYFPADVRISHAPWLNVAYWNAQERRVERRDGHWQIGDDRVLFFHLSGYKLAQPDLACAYVSREANATLFAAAPWLKRVLDEYRALLAPYFANHEPAPYPFKTFDGVFLNDDFRRLLFRTGRLDRGSAQFWRIWIVQHLRMLKRLLTGVRPLR